MLVLYSDKTTSFSTLGIGVLRDFVSDPLITEELNGAYTLEFSYSKTGYLVDSIVEGAIIKANNQPFRIWSVKKDMDKVEVLAKHIFFDLSTNFLEDVAPTKLNAQEALDWIIKRAQKKTLFKVSGDCSIIASSRYVRKNITDAIYNEDNAILKRFGGELELDGYNVIVHAKRGKNANFSIRYKKNLTGIEFNLDFSTVATRIMPQGANELLLDQKYVDSPLIENYFTPIYKKVEFSNIGVDEDTSEEEAKKLLLEQAQQLFNAGIDKPEISIKVDFVELSKCVEYKDYSNLESCNLGDTIKAIIPELNINLETRIVKTVYNCSLNRFTTLELGTVKPDFVSNQSKVVNEINNAVSQVNPESILSKAKEEATNIINHPFSGNIYIDKNTGVLYLMDTNDISTSRNIWRWSLGGLGFSKNGVNGPYETAITQDGSIVADFITTGKINTSLIEGYDQLVLSVSNTEKRVEEIQTITNTLEGNPIKIDNALENPLQKLVITGDGEITNDILKVYRKNEQLDYPEIEMTKNSNSGKNLINNILQSKIINGITIVVNADKSITLNGTSTSEFYPILTNNFKLENKQYTLSSIAEMQDSKIKMVIRQSTQNVQIVQLFSGNETTFNSTYTDEVYAYLVIRANQTFDNFTIYPMLVEGDLSTEYEPYDSHGGQYYVDGITTQQTRNGRQLYNVNDVQTMTSGMTVDEEGWISVSCDNTIGTSTKYFNYFTNNLDLKPNTQYSIITEIKEVSGELTIYCVSRMNNGGQFVNSVSYSFNNPNSNLVYKKLDTTIDNFDNVIYGLRTFVQFSKGQSGSIKFRLSVLGDTTINENNFVYEPYGIMPSPDYPSEIINKYPSGTYKTIIGNKPYIIKLDDDLRSVGEVADRLWLDITNNIAEVEKKISKVVLNGSENWQEFYMTKTNTNVFSINSTYLSNNYQNSYNKITALSDYFKCYGLGTLYGNDDIEAIELNSNTSYSIQIGISKDIASSVSEFKQWLSETNTEVQYVLSIPLLQTIQMESIYQQYKLNISSLLTLNETKDEYVLENGKAIIIKKIGINENGEKYVLNTPLISDLGQLYIQLANGVNILEFLNNFNMEATYFVDNDFTRKFANQINSSSEFNEQNNLLNQTSTDLNELSNKLSNDYTNNSKLNQLLEGQKATIIEETSTMISQSASEVTTSIINKVNTDGVTTLKNTLVTIDINGINVAKNDEDVVSLLDNKGLYVSDGKLREDESNLLMKTDRNGAYFKSATIDGTIKEQGLFQKEVIEDVDFGKGQAGFWIGG